eukprot:3543260-Pleurochrysis_carterae.AAC.1
MQRLRTSRDGRARTQVRRKCRGPSRCARTRATAAAPPSRSDATAAQPSSSSRPTGRARSHTVRAESPRQAGARTYRYLRRNGRTLQHGYWTRSHGAMRSQRGKGALWQSRAARCLGEGTSKTACGA